ncbi:MAG TPA: flagellar protein FlgN [Rhodocyclaceae bacterium]|nr:flagellar protein FlgN [Rhodocyclaceae bacterium]
MPLAPRFFQILNEEIALLRRFLTLLEEEQHALIAGTNEGLAKFAQAKSELSLQLDQLDRALVAEQSKGGFPPGSEGVKDWLAQAQPQQQKVWATFLELASAAKATNELNGRIITERLIGNQQAIQALMAAANKPATYGPKGQAFPIGGGRTLGSA